GGLDVAGGGVEGAVSAQRETDVAADAVAADQHVAQVVLLAEVVLAGQAQAVAIAAGMGAGGVVAQLAGDAGHADVAVVTLAGPAHGDVGQVAVVVGGARGAAVGANHGLRV